MRFKLFIILCFGLYTNALQAQTKADDVLGIWLSAEKDGKIQIFKQDGKYFGKVVWGKETKKDKENPDPKLRNQDIIGSVIMKGFVFKTKSWEDGTIYDPNNGKTYSSLMKLKNINTLEIRGYIGISLIGRTTTWTRTTL